MRTNFTPDRRIQSALNTPTEFNAAGQGAFVNLFNARPFFKRLSFAVKSYQVICSLIQTLLGRRRPSNVSFFVMTVYIFSVNTMLRRGFFAQNFHELIKAAKSKFDTAPAIVGIKNIVRVFAPTLRAHVSDVFRFVKFQISGFSVAARSCVTSFQVGDLGDSKSAAIATSKPKRFMMSVLVKQTNYRQFAEFLSGQILKVFTWFKRIVFVKFDVSHFVFLYTENDLVRACASVSPFAKPVSILL
jgi:hypothetical protein